jgi:crossover junction endodeoxyribonuclease RuvC
MPKKKEAVEIINFPETYKVLGADLSLKQPGFCILSIDNGLITDVKLYSVNNKQDKKKSHGQLLDEIGSKFKEIFPVNCDTFIVRENEIMKVKVPSERSLSKVVGLMDWLAWALFGKEWYSIYPVTVKKLVTGNGRAEKTDVAKCLDNYIGKQTYKCDDESDAAAVAIAWLIQQGQIKQKENADG